MAIYFVQPENGGLIKIGYTSGAIESRISSLQTGCPDKLVLLRVEEGDQKREASLHREFAHLRVTGEWFKPGLELLERIVGVQDVQAKLLSAHAHSYVNCLWSHSPVNPTDSNLLNVLMEHASYVATNSGECWEYLRANGVKDVCWKKCQYFFSFCWPIHEPWQNLSKRVLKELESSGQIEGLPFKSFDAELRPIYGLSDEEVFRGIHQPPGCTGGAP